MRSVFSVCLYNAYNPFYYDRLLKNIDLIHIHFPDWEIYVYIGNDVPPWFQEKLASLGCTLRYTNVEGDLNMVHRYFAIDEDGVDIMIVRDVDSYIHWKDRWAIREFLRSSYKFHGIRDSDVHCAPMTGGLWGMRKQSNFSIRELYEQYKLSGKEYNARGNDQTFLRLFVYPIARPDMLIHYSHESVAYPNENLVRFPFQWTENFFCGRN